FLELGGLCKPIAAVRMGTAVRDLLRVENGRLRGSLAAAYGFLVALPANRALAALLAHVATAVRARQLEDAVLTFDDPIAEPRPLLVRSPAVRARYARRFRAVLVDEFQDTDRVQADIIHRLAEPPGPTLFVVGDEKQSIYRFRGADVAVFHDTRAR